ncbi:hypothetical protein POM88_045887 [Heracleum sosnowskyi]|uniref:Uncharacterized protein n=1 Tax=Heracleum sosnowskyi TaxID=360622 RepID=A0AAD8M6W0_9APIA|nr:hypothetical protein POM88_045887 [Heracleum sosnowskyi]
MLANLSIQSQSPLLLVSFSKPSERQIRSNGARQMQLPKFCSFVSMTVLGKPSTIRLEGRGDLESKIKKQMRLNSNVTGSKPVTEILEINFNVHASKILDVQIFLLSKRRVQFEQTIEFMLLIMGSISMAQISLQMAVAPADSEFLDVRFSLGD